MSTTILQEVQFLDKYSRYRYDLGRRENWSDTVKRVTDYLFSFDKENVITEQEREEITEAIYNKDVTPSMRNLASSGEAAKRNNIASFNCGYVAVDELYVFYEIVMILISGCGLGYSVENQYISKLPPVKPQKENNKSEFVIPDTSEGWAAAVYFGIASWFSGEDVDFDFSEIRPAGAILKIKGGRASGPDVLQESLTRIRNIVLSKQGEKLSSLDVHDIATNIARCIVSGGVRRCLPEGSKVHTKYGMKNIEAVGVGDEVLTSDGYHKVSNKFNQGSQRVVKVITQDSAFECTPNHKIAVISDMSDNYIWKTAETLVPGDRLIAPSFGIYGKDQYLPEFNYVKPLHSTTCKDIKIPELDSEMSWFLGLVQGDGYVRLTSKSGEVSIAITKDAPNIGNRASHQLSRFGTNVKTIDYENYYVVRTKSKQLATYFHSWLKQPNTDLKVPNFIWGATQDVKLAYVSGLMDADGSIKTKPVCVLVTVYEEFARELQVLLSSCGVQTRIKKLSESNLKTNWQTKFGVYLINNKSKEIFKNIPTLSKSDISVNIERNTNSYKNGYGKNSNMSWSKTNNKLIPVEFIGMEDVTSTRKTWDLEIENKHEFFSNGYLVHNSACLCLFDYDDDLMLTCKSSENIKGNEQRYLSNNSAVFEDAVSLPELRLFMNRMFESYSGEPGIFSRYAIKKALPNRRESAVFGTNACTEIILRNMQFCNLTSVVPRESDDLTSLRKKVKFATILGTLQAMSDYFPGLREGWKINQQDERLLGVDINNIMSVEFVRDPRVLENIRQYAVDVNHEYAIKLKIKPATAITCVKPSGNASVMLNTSAGIHPHWSDYYIRRIQLSDSNPILEVLKRNNVPVEPSNHLPQTYVASFPIKAPEGAITNGTFSAIDQLENWKLFKTNWAEHSVSCTISYHDDEQEDIINWLYNNQDIISGLSFLPKSDAIYEQMPYEKITKEQYELMAKDFPTEIDWNLLHELETEDQTNASQTAGCSSDKCLVSF